MYRSVCLYLSLATEVDTSALVTHVLEGGKKCYIPRYCMAGLHMYLERVCTPGAGSTLWIKYYRYCRY